MIVYVKEPDEVDFYDESTRLAPALLAACPASGIEIRFSRFLDNTELIVYRKNCGMSEELQSIDTSAADFWKNFTMLLRSIYGREGYDYNKRTYKEYIKEKAREQRYHKVNNAIDNLCKSLGIIATGEQHNILFATITDNFPSLI